MKSFRLPAMSPVPEFILPASFDFGFGSNNINNINNNSNNSIGRITGGGGGGGGGGHPADAVRKIKSSLRGSGDASGRKSISFGPTTTFTSTDQLDDAGAIMATG